MQEDVRITVNKQQHQIFDMDKWISFYSGSIVQLEGKKAEEVKAHFDVLEHCIAGQDDQIEVLLHRLAAAKEGRHHCRESTPKGDLLSLFQFDPKLLTVMMGRRVKCIDGINPTIYYYKNSHSHMIKSHDWLVQPTPTETDRRCAGDQGGGLPPLLDS